MTNFFSISTSSWDFFFAHVFFVESCCRNNHIAKYETMHVHTYPHTDIRCTYVCDILPVSYTAYCI